MIKSSAYSYSICRDSETNQGAFETNINILSLGINNVTEYSA